MAKPSITNIRAPSTTSVWTPPKSTWDLNNTSDQDAWYATNDHDSNTTTNSFDNLIAQINLAGTDLTTDDLNAWYDYVFLGVNGGADETVTGRTDAAGIIVTGNGMDNVTGGGYGDLVLAGNGMDTVHGGGGEDIIYGENGKDMLFGDANNDWIYGGNGDDTIAGGTDNGPAPWVFVPGTSETITHLVLNDGIDPMDAGDPVDWSWVVGDGRIIENGMHAGEYRDNSGSLHKEGAYLDTAGNIHQVWSFDSMDLPILNVNDPHDFTVAVYGAGLAQANLIGKVGTFTALENQKVFFSIDLGHLGAETAFSNGQHVVVFLGDLSESQLEGIADPQQAGEKTEGFGGLMSFYHEETTTVETPGHWEFQWAGAGDVLTGGADADTFVYGTGDGVDEITDYNRAEGDVLKLVGISADTVEIISDETDSYVVFTDADDPSGHVQDAAIKIVGVNDFSVNEIAFA